MQASTGSGDDPAQSGARILAVANQKGGVGKTTTAVNLGAALADMGQRVVVVDLDPQGNASTGLGIDPGRRPLTSYDVVMGRADVRDALVETMVDGLLALPATADLAGAEVELVGQQARETLLKRALEPLVTDQAVILLDCPPSLGLLTVNALCAASEVLVPVQCEYFALEGLGQLVKNLRLVQRNINPRLRLNGIVLTMYDARTKLAEQVVSEIRAHFGDAVYRTTVPRSVRLSEAPSFGLPIVRYDPTSKGAAAYRALAAEFLVREAPNEPIGMGQAPAVATRDPKEPRSGDGQVVHQRSAAAANARPIARSDPEGEPKAIDDPPAPSTTGHRLATTSLPSALQGEVRPGGEGEPEADDRGAGGLSDGTIRPATSGSTSGNAFETQRAGGLIAGGPKGAAAAIPTRTRRFRWPFGRSKGGPT